MSPLSLTGLASGLDSESIITQLMNVERQPRTRMTQRDTQAQARQNWLNDLATKLSAVRTAATALNSSSTWADTQDIASSDPTRVAVRGLGAVAPGTHAVEVTQVATSSQRTFSYTASSTAQTITVGSFSLAVDPDSTIGTVAAAINARSDSPVGAVVAGGKLVLTRRDTGNTDLTIGATPLLVEDAARARQGVDAQYSVDGVAQPASKTNVITGDLGGGVLGLEMTLKATTTAPVTVTVGNPGVDGAGAKTKVKDFVNAYNTAVDFIRNKLEEKPVKNASTNSELTRGLFFGDRMLTGMLSAMRSQIGDLADVGISTGAPSGTAKFSQDAVDGHLTVDDAKLTAALASDPTGLATRLKALGDRLTAATDTGSGSVLAARQTTESATRKRLADAMTAMDVRLATKETRLRAQFAAMESALAAAQAAQSQMAAQLSSLS